VFRAGAGNAALAGVAFGVFALAASYMDGRNLVVAVPFAATIIVFFAWQYVRIVCAYCVSPGGVTLVTPLRTEYIPAAALTGLQMRELPLRQSCQIIVRRRGRRFDESYIVLGDFVTPTASRVELQTMASHFNRAAADMLATNSPLGLRRPD
jgi:hypothetical protein